MSGHAKRTNIAWLEAPPLPAWTVLPLRLFLGATFLLAGLDKLADPTFLDPAARTYLGNQIAGFAPGTPLEGPLLAVAVPNAALFGVLVMGGEICIGLAVLLGVLTRFSALMGLLINLTFFLSATWAVRPFYFGADLPYAAAWLTLLLTGPGPLALDAVLARHLAAPAPIQGRSRGALWASLPAVPGPSLTRRAFLGLGAASLAGALLAATGIGWGLLHGRREEAGSRVAGTGPTPTPSPAVPSTATVPAAAVAPASATVPPSATALPPPATVAPAVSPAAVARAGHLLVAAGALPVGQARSITLPSGEPAVLAHTAGGYRAYNAVCTHGGCTVIPGAGGLLVCPCHSSHFDPAAGARPVDGPAPRPLAPVPLVVAPDGSVYLDEG